MANLNVANVFCHSRLPLGTARVFHKYVSAVVAAKHWPCAWHQQQISSSPSHLCSATGNLSF